jgi:hypothetical protein
MLFGERSQAKTRVRNTFRTRAPRTRCRVKFSDRQGPDLLLCSWFEPRLAMGSNGLLRERSNNVVVDSKSGLMNEELHSLSSPHFESGKMGFGLSPYGQPISSSSAR